MATRTHASPKADFILGLPSSLSVAEVVERAAAAGMSLSGSMVRKTRASGAPRANVSSGGAKRSSASTSTDNARTAARPGSKRAFVLSYPHDTPAGDIVTAAKSKGLQLPAGYVYWVRSDAARKARQGQPKGATRGSESRRPGRRGTGREARADVGASSAPARTSQPLANRDAEALLLQTALRVVGIERAIDLLKAARERIDRLLQD